MITFFQAFQMMDVYAQVHVRFCELLRDGQWHTFQEARACLPPALAETAYRHSGEVINDQHPDKSNTIQVMYSDLLIGEIVTWLVDEGLCKSRHKNGADLFRMTGVTNGNNKGKNGKRSASKPAARSPHPHRTDMIPYVAYLLGILADGLAKVEPTKKAKSKKPPRNIK